MKVNVIVTSPDISERGLFITSPVKNELLLLFYCILRILLKFDQNVLILNLSMQEFLFH